MRSPEHFLKELLFDYDCVTIPGIGGFIMQNQPAKIDRVKHRIHPPARFPAFNTLLDHDDGLLTNCIARTEGHTYQEAGAIVHAFGEKLKWKLSRGENIVLDGIGTLKPGAEQQIIFTPSREVNFNADAFGMDAINLQPLTATATSKRTLAKPVDRTDREKHKKQPASVRWTLALALPVVLFLLYGIIFPSSIQKMATNYTGMAMDFLRRESANPVAEQPVMASETIESEALAVEPVITSEPVNEDNPVTEPAETTSTTSADQSPLKYYIIGGCFGNKENADKFLSELLEKGYQAEQAGVTKKGHVRISYKSFSDREPALLYLQRIKEKENPAAWLLKF